MIIISSSFPSEKSFELLATGIEYIVGYFLSAAPVFVEVPFSFSAHLEQLSRHAIQARRLTHTDTKELKEGGGLVQNSYTHEREGERESCDHARSRDASVSAPIGCLATRTPLRASHPL